MIDSVKRCSQIQENEKGWGAAISRHQEVVRNPDQSCFCAVGGAETRLKFLKKVVGFKMVLKLSGNYFFQNLREKWEIGNGPVVGKNFRV